MASEIFMAVFVGLLLIALTWRHGYTRGREDGVDRFLKAYGKALREQVPVEHEQRF